MSWSYPIGRYKGTVVRVHVTLLIFFAWIAFSYYVVGGARAAFSGLVFIVLVFACVTAHEFGHVLVARRYGVRTPDILLLPIGGASRMEEIPHDPKQEAMIGVAGPLVSLAIGVLLIAILGRLPGWDDFAPERLTEPSFPLPQLALLNLILAAFNLLPAFPMDGGRILRALLSIRMGRLRATRTAALIGQGFAILFGLFGLMSGNLILLLIAVFLFFTASSENGTVRLSEAARGLSAADVMITAFESLPAHASVDDAADALIRTTQAEFPVLDEDGRFEGMLTRDHILAALRGRDRATSVADVMQRDIPTVPRGSAADGILAHFGKGVPAVAVLDPSGRLLGYITVQNLLESMMIVEAPGLDRRLSQEQRTATHTPGM